MSSSASTWESDARPKLSAALAPHAGGHELAEAADAMRRLGEAGLRDPAAHQAFARLMYDVYRHPDHGTFGARRWLARELAVIEEAYVEPAAEPAEALPPEAFTALLRDEHKRGPTKRNHPYTAHLFGDALTADQLRAYVADLWFRSRGFYREWTEFTLSFGLDEPDDLLGDVYMLLASEGGGGGRITHTAELRVFLNKIGVSAHPHERPPSFETIAYLNNRMRCLSHPNVAWGLGMSFALENQTLQTFDGLRAALHRVLGVSPEDTEPYFGHHFEVDNDHASTILSAAGKALRTADQQRACVASLRHHMKLAYATMDPLWAAIRDARDAAR